MKRIIITTINIIIITIIIMKSHDQTPSTAASSFLSL